MEKLTFLFQFLIEDIQHKDTFKGFLGFGMMISYPFLAEFNHIIAAIVAICGVILSVIKIKHSILLYKHDKEKFLKSKK